MALPQPSSAETRQRITKLRELLQQPSSKDRVAPLVTALMARDVDIHERMLTDLSNKVQQIHAANNSNSEDTARLLERMNNIEQDAKSLRQLITEADQDAIAAKTDHNQLKVELTNAIDQHHKQIADVEQHLKTIKDIMEQRQQTNVEIMETVDVMAKNRQCLQSNIHEIQNGLKGMPSGTPIVENMTKLIGLMTEYLDQTSFIAGIGNKRDTDETSAGNTPTSKHPARDEVDESKGRSYAIKAKLPLYQVYACFMLTLINKSGPNQTQLHEFPAITEFLIVYEEFIQTYKFTRPGNEKEFVEAFLNSLNIHVSCAVQRQLLKICPSRVTLASVKAGQQFPNIFVDLNRMDWKTIRRVIPKIKDLRVLQWALNEGMSGPPPSLTSRQGKRERKRSCRGSGVRQGPEIVL